MNAWVARILTVLVLALAGFWLVSATEWADTEVSTPASGEAMALYFALRPDVSPDLLSYRLRHGACTFFDMIFERDKNVAEGLAVMPEAEFLAEGLGMLEAICLRPAPSA